MKYVIEIAIALAESILSYIGILCGEKLSIRLYAQVHPESLNLHPCKFHIASQITFSPHLLAMIRDKAVDHMRINVEMRQLK